MLYTMKPAGMLKSLVFVLASLIFSFAAGVSPPPDGGVDKLHDAEGCKALGFSQALSCSTCERMKDIVADEGKEKQAAQYTRTANVSLACLGEEMV